MKGAKNPHVFDCLCDCRRRKRRSSTEDIRVEKAFASQDGGLTQGELKG